MFIAPILWCWGCRWGWGSAADFQATWPCGLSAQVCVIPRARVGLRTCAGPPRASGPPGPQQPSLGPVGSAIPGPGPGGSRSLSRPLGDLLQQQEARGGLGSLGSALGRRCGSSACGSPASRAGKGGVQPGQESSEAGGALGAPQVQGRLSSAPLTHAVVRGRGLGPAAGLRLPGAADRPRATAGQLSTPAPKRGAAASEAPGREPRGPGREVPEVCARGTAAWQASFHPLLAGVTQQRHRAPPSQACSACVPSTQQTAPSTSEVPATQTNKGEWRMRISFLQILACHISLG